MNTNGKARQDHSQPQRHWIFTSYQKPKNLRRMSFIFFVVQTLMAVRSTKEQHSNEKEKSAVATQAESVVSLPGRASGCVIVTMTFAQATVLRVSLEKNGHIHI